MQDCYDAEINNPIIFPLEGIWTVYANWSTFTPKLCITKVTYLLVEIFSKKHGQGLWTGNSWKSRFQWPLHIISLVHNLIIIHRAAMNIGVHVCFFFSFLGLRHLQHMEVSRLGVELELQLLAYTTATVMQDPNHVYTTSHDNTGSLTPWVRPGIKSTSSWILVRFVNCWTTMGTPTCIFLS